MHLRHPEKGRTPESTVACGLRLSPEGRAVDFFEFIKIEKYYLNAIGRYDSGKYSSPVDLYAPENPFGKIISVRPAVTRCERYKNQFISFSKDGLKNAFWRIEYSGQ